MGVEIAALHRVPAHEAHELDLRRVSYLSMLDQIDAQLGGRGQLRNMRTALIRMRDWFAALPEDPVIALCDLQMHNMTVDGSTGGLAGIFDFDDAAIAHRLEDFKYLLSFGVTFTKAALEAYSAASGQSLSFDDVCRFHVLSALEHFTFVDDTSARWAEIIEWSCAALDQFGI